MIAGAILFLVTEDAMPQTVLQWRQRYGENWHAHPQWYQYCCEIWMQTTTPQERAYHAGFCSLSGEQMALICAGMMS